VPAGVTVALVAGAGAGAAAGLLGEVTGLGAAVGFGAAVGVEVPVGDGDAEGDELGRGDELWLPFQADVLCDDWTAEIVAIPPKARSNTAISAVIRCFIFGYVSVGDIGMRDRGHESANWQAKMPSA